MTHPVNHRIVLARRPAGAPSLEDFRFEDVPVVSPSDGEVELETLFLSLDPYMRGRMDAGPSYAPPVALDAPMEGGAVFDAVLPLLNTCARVPVCGLISQYNATGLPPGPDRVPLLMGTLLSKRIRMQGFIIFQDYGHRIAEFQEAMGNWVKDGSIQAREDVVEGLASAPEAFLGLLQGRNFGKLIVRVAKDAKP
jgi:NADPH-dependent curcumin reductase CurA